MISKENSELVDALASLRTQFLKAWALALCSGLLLLAPSVYMLEVYDRVVNSRSPMTLAMLTLLVLMVYGVIAVFDWARSELLREAGDALDDLLGPRLFRAMFDARRYAAPGGNFQVQRDLRTLREFLPSTAVCAALESPVALVFLILVFAIHPWLGWLALAGALVQLALVWLNERSTRPLMAQAIRNASESQQQLDAMLRNVQVVYAMDMQSKLYRRWHQLQQQFLGQQARASARAGSLQATTKFWQNLVGSGMLGLACWLLLRNQLTGGAGMMIVASILGGRILAPLVQGVSQWQSIVQVIDAWKRLTHLLETTAPRTPAMPLPRPRGALQVENLVAAAPGSSVPILRGLYFAVPPGEVLAVVGPSAAGKSTLARLLTGLWPAGNGKVRLDGADLFAWDKSELGPSMGYLPQGVDLIDGSLAENIARFGPVDMPMVERAAELVGLHAWAQQLPQGYQTRVGSDGSLLSGGWRQRVGLARALFGEPVFVVLDEPNSSLDAAGDQALSAAITQLKASGTTFVIMTHRISVLDVADKVLVLRDGQTQAFGPRDEVLQSLRQATVAQVAPRPVMA